MCQIWNKFMLISNKNIFPNVPICQTPWQQQYAGQVVQVWYFLLSEQISLKCIVLHFYWLIWTPIFKKKCGSFHCVFKIERSIYLAVLAHGRVYCLEGKKGVVVESSFLFTICNYDLSIFDMCNFRKKKKKHKKEVWPNMLLPGG